MARKDKSTEEIIGLLREAEARISQGETVGKICHRCIGTDLLHLWTALPLQVDFELIRRAPCKHLSGVTR